MRNPGRNSGCDSCPFLSTSVHPYKQQRPLKLEAFTLQILNLDLYARRDSNPNHWLRRPTTSSLRVIVFIILTAFFIFPGCDLGAKVSAKSVMKMRKYEYMQLSHAAFAEFFEDFVVRSYHLILMLHIHHPNVAQFLFPGEVQMLAVCRQCYYTHLTISISQVRELPIEPSRIDKLHMLPRSSKKVTE